MIKNSPQDTAKRLSIKFCNSIDVVKPNKGSIRMAIKAVDELINMAIIYHNNNVVLDTKIFTELSIEYWKEVKQHLENHD